MAAETLRELFVDELRDMYDGGKQLTKALPKMASAAESRELRQAFTAHLKETRGQVTRLERALRMLDEPVRGKPCEGIKGIVDESKEVMKELDEGPILDAALIAGAQKVEHYEIASYGTLAYYADLLGESDVKALLGASLTEEKGADDKLNGLAKSKVNREALAAAGVEESESGDERQTGRKRGSNGRGPNGRASNGRGSNGRAKSSGKNGRAKRGGVGSWFVFK